jgi:single-stranded DNA-binding protein
MVGDVVKAEFIMVVYTYRRTKSGEKNKIPTYLYCEAWHTGAETLEKYATKGTKISIHATAKNVSKENLATIFRVNEFDFCQQDVDY